MTAIFLVFLALVALVLLAATIRLALAPRSLGHVRRLEAMPATGERRAIVSLQCARGTALVELDDETAARLSSDLLFLAAALAPREPGTTVPGGQA